MDSSSSVVRTIPTGPQVFICFRGIDVDNNFISFLKPSLRDANINVFIGKDEVVGTDLNNLVGIQESRVSVVIFSKDYPSSQWYLDELAQIKDCIDQGGLSVIAIFYKIEHSSIKELLSGDFGENYRVLRSQHLQEPERT